MKCYHIRGYRTIGSLFDKIEIGCRGLQRCGEFPIYLVLLQFHQTVPLVPIVVRERSRFVLKCLLWTVNIKVSKGYFRRLCIIPAQDAVFLNLPYEA